MRIRNLFDYSFVQSDFRPLKQLPTALKWAVPLLLCLQLTWHQWRGGPSAEAVTLNSPPSTQSLRVMLLGEEAVAARLLMLWLTSYDTQPGVSLPYASLDYGRLIEWLELALVLDPRTQSPLLSATRLYGSVADEAKRRQMLAFVHRVFLKDPNRHWRWMAEAVLIAKHRLQDLPLALSLAADLTRLTTDPQVPFWARDMQIIVLEDMGEFESAQVLVGGLLDAGEIKDPNEIRFLQRKLEELRARQNQSEKR